MTFHPGAWAKFVTTLSTGGMTVGCQILNNDAKVFLLEARLVVWR